MIPTKQSRLDAFRHHRDHYFAHDPDSPLSDADRAGFAGLRYYPEREDLALELEIETDGPGIGERLDLTTSDGSSKPFIRAGRVSFVVDGQPVTLAVFKDVERGRFFLPFKDGTSGFETYGAGRYLDPRARPDGKLVVDFNYAYNPYCAYGEGWSCPVPPRENVVAEPIRAGEMAFAPKGSEDNLAG